MPLGQLAELLDRALQELGVGREGDVLGLHRGVHRDPGQIALAKRPGVVAILKLSANRISSRSPIRLRQWLRPERSWTSWCWKNSSPVKYWK